MKLKEVTYFTEKEEDVVNILMNLGLRKTAAKVLVYLTSKPESTTQDIERGANLRQSEVSLATAYMMDKEWMACLEVRGKKTGRPMKTFRLSKPLPEIFDSIEEQKKNEIRAKLLTVKKLRAFADECSAIPPQVYRDEPVPGDDHREPTVSGTRICERDPSTECPATITSGKMQESVRLSGAGGMHMKNYR